MGSRGPAPTPAEKLKARGSYRIDRHGPKVPPPKKRPKGGANWKPLSEGELLRLIREIPGYDPFAQAEGYTFDAARANRALAFFHNDLVHIEGAVAGRRFRLEQWQQAMVANLFGWVRWSPQWRRWVRRYRECLVYVPRKNGKSPLAAGLALYELVEGEEAGQQNYLAASTREQAGKLFRYVKGMARVNPRWEKLLKVYGGTAQAGQAKSVVRLPEETSFLQVIAADADAAHGGTSHLLLIDELHAQPGRELVDTLGTSMASENRAEPLIVYLTTADCARESICNEKRDYAVKVRDNIVHDPAFLPVIYEATPADDWTDEAVWARVNPNLGVSVSLDYLRRECAKAKENPQLENTFKRLHLNIRTEADVRWLSSVLWDACAALPGDLSGRDCYAGLDLANTLDVAALVLVFPPKEGESRWHVLPFFWVPQEVARHRERKNKASYDAWLSRGFMTATAGDVIDYSFIRARLGELAGQYRILKLAYDPFNATHLALELQADGLAVEEFRQSLENYNEPCRKLEELLMAGQLAHGGHPVLRWMANNCAVHTDGRGYKMPSRKKSTDKIDGISALLMGLGKALAERNAPSVYTGRGVLTLGAPEAATGPARPAPAPAEAAPAGDKPAPGWWGSWGDEGDED